jgi:outer membrane protein TolC
VAATDDSAYYRAPPPLDTAALRKEAMANAPVITSAEASLTAAQDAWKSSKATYYPTLSATAAQSWTGNWTTPSPANSSSTTGLQARRSLAVTLQVSPWTSYARETSIERAAIQITNAEATLADMRNQISAQINQAYATLSTAVETINVSTAAVTAGTEALRVVTERYRTGVATITDVLTAQQALTTAQVSQLQARYSYLNAKAQLEQVLGRKL